ncbi:GvpL/GvpF family gas vesicle protein [Streptomyces goshikiensis]|uniref:GvpL/GvpF family gas vesicle protein n=1 Tax=Streptomyces goshikiensis TaxID=1942 RepID=A0ABZ1RD32_9ACTN|nr:GvpL/GvpF family gas vesicle protein [Streptomyces goshikiensis]
MNTTALTYVYAVTQPTSALDHVLPALHGISRGRPLRLLPTAVPTATASGGGSAPLAFVAADVPERDFNEAALKNHFEDLDWLEYVARAHHDVVQAVAAHAPVLPLRMATVYQDDHRARQALTAQHRTFSELFDQLRAHTEYGVKIYLTPSTTPDTEQAPVDSPAPPISPGKAYLRARKTQQHTREAAYQEAQQAAQAIDAITTRYTTHRVRHAPQRGALTAAQENVLNDAYLIPDDQAEEFQTSIAEAARHFPDLRIEVTGPWAPYSFATPPPEPPDASSASSNPDAPAAPPQLP